MVLYYIVPPNLRHIKNFILPKVNRELGKHWDFKEQDYYELQYEIKNSPTQTCFKTLIKHCLSVLYCKCSYNRIQISLI